MHTAPLPAAEQKRFGPYVLISEIARGTFGRLWTACRRLDSGEGEAVLIRRLQKRSPLDAAALAGVERAVELTIPITAEHLARIRGIEQTEEELGVIFDYADGKDLKSLLGIAPLKHMRAPPPVAIHVIASALESLAALKRDLPEELSTAAIWPDSIFVGADGNTRLLDPSISAALARDPGPKRFPQLVGYSSPEEFGDDDDLDQSDVFRAGVLLWEMLAAKRLFTGGTTNTTIEQVQHAPIPELEGLAEEHTPLVGVVKQALAQDRAVRYGNTDELLEALAGSGVPRASDADVAAFMTELVGTGLAAQQRAVAIALERVVVVEEADATEPSPKLALATATPAPVAKTVMSPAVPPPARPGRSETLLGVPAPAILGAKPLPLPPPPRRDRPPMPMGAVPLDLAAIDDIEAPLPSNPKPVRTDHSGIALLDSLEASDIAPVSAPADTLSDDDLVEQPLDDDLLAPVVPVAASSPPPELAQELDSIAPGPQPRFKRTHVMAVAAGIALLLLSVGVLAVVGRSTPTEDAATSATASNAEVAASPVETQAPPPAPEPKPIPRASAVPAESAEPKSMDADAGEATVAAVTDGEKAPALAKQSLVQKKATTAKPLTAKTKTTAKPKPKTTAKTKAKTKTTAKKATSKTAKKKTTKKTVKPKKKTK